MKLKTFENVYSAFQKNPTFAQCLSYILGNWQNGRMQKVQLLRVFKPCFGVLPSDENYKLIDTWEFALYL